MPDTVIIILVSIFFLLVMGAGMWLTMHYINKRINRQFLQLQAAFGGDVHYIRLMGQNRFPRLKTHWQAFPLMIAATRARIGPKRYPTTRTEITLPEKQSVDFAMEPARATAADFEAARHAPGSPEKLEALLRFHHGETQAIYQWLQKANEAMKNAGHRPFTALLLEQLEEGTWQGAMAVQENMLVYQEVVSSLYNNRQRERYQTVVETLLTLVQALYYRSAEQAPALNEGE